MILRSPPIETDHRTSDKKIVTTGDLIRRIALDDASSRSAQIKSAEDPWIADNNIRVAVLMIEVVDPHKSLARIDGAIDALGRCSEAIGNIADRNTTRVAGKRPDDVNRRIARPRCCGAKAHRIYRVGIPKHGSKAAPRIGGMIDPVVRSRP